MKLVRLVDAGQSGTPLGKLLETLMRRFRPLHIVNHTSYHRNFVSEMNFNLKVRAPAADLTVFLRDARSDLA